MNPKSSDLSSKSEASGTLRGVLVVFEGDGVGGDVSLGFVLGRCDGSRIAAESCLQLLAA